MFNIKVLLLAIFLLASDVFAIRINYSAKYKVGKKIERTSKNGGEVPDAAQDEIIQNMGRWSNGAYSAGLSKHGMIQVVNSVPAASKGAASGQVQQMQTIVRQNI